MNEEEKKKEESFLKTKKSRISYILFYCFTFILSLIMYNSNTMIEVNLGDFGNIINLVFTIISVYGFKWIMIFSVIGIVLVAIRKFEDVNRVYFSVILLLLIASVLIKILT